MTEFEPIPEGARYVGRWKDGSISTTYGSPTDHGGNVIGYITEDCVLTLVVKRPRYSVARYSSARYGLSVTVWDSKHNRAESMFFGPNRTVDADARAAMLNEQDTVVPVEEAAGVQMNREGIERNDRENKSVEDVEPPHDSVIVQWDGNWTSQYAWDGEAWMSHDLETWKPSLRGLRLAMPSSTFVVVERPEGGAK